MRRRGCGYGGVFLVGIGLGVLTGVLIDSVLAAVLVGLGCICAGVFGL